MKNFYRFKMKYQRYAIRNLAKYMTIIYAVTYLLMVTGAGNYLYWQFLAFSPAEVMHGQIWRIITAIVYPPFANDGMFMALLGIFIFYNFSSLVEQVMGEFEYNLYFFGSFIIGELGAIVFYLLTGINMPFMPLYTQFSVFMAFAVLFPDASVLLMFALPIKAKYFAMIELLIYAFQLIRGSLYTKVSIIAAIIPVVLFFILMYNRRGGNIINDIKAEIRHKQRQKEWKDQWK